jgi:hypothetical protein
VIATNREGVYAADLTKEDFELWEDGVKQELAFFGTVTAPFHVVLMLDTSASTQESIGQIRKAAIAFVEQLQSQDKVKVISFDDEIRDHNDFSSDRAAVRAAIGQARSGQGTKLYDAFELALNSIRRIQGRKAIVIFTDGMDWHSDRASFDSTLRGLDEEGVIVYPIRYDTREQTERLAREQADNQVPQLPTIGVIRAPSSGTTAPTLPSDDPDSMPTAGSRSKTGPFGLPLPEEIMRRRREQRDRDRDRYPNPDQMPDPNRRTDPRTTMPDGGSTRPARRDEHDSIDAMLDQAYLTADSYLTALERKSGGRLVRADTISSLPAAFAQIAAELRTQYTLGYYPSNRSGDGKYRKIKVSTKKNVVIRSRPGYLATSGS